MNCERAVEDGVPLPLPRWLERRMVARVGLGDSPRIRVKQGLNVPPGKLLRGPGETDTVLSANRSEAALISMSKIGEGRPDISGAKRRRCSSRRVAQIGQRLIDCTKDFTFNASRLTAAGCPPHENGGSMVRDLRYGAIRCLRWEARLIGLSWLRSAARFGMVATIPEPSYVKDVGNGGD